MTIPTRQEMLDRAVRGLRAQGWRRATIVDSGGGCAYLTADGRRCAWGHVDPEATSGAHGIVAALARRGVGLAARLSTNDLDFANRLQCTHDAATDETLEESFRRFCEREGLQWPGGVAMTCITADNPGPFEHWADCRYPRARCICGFDQRGQSEVDITDDDIRDLYHIACRDKLTDLQTLCEVALGEGTVTAPIARAALRVEVMKRRRTS